MADFDIVPPDDIAAGRATDAYFLRTEEALDAAGRNPTVVAEVTASQFPDGTFRCFAGVEDAARLLAGIPVDVDALEEGQLFDGGPVLRIEGTYRAFTRYETALLGFLSQATGYATRALEARRAAPDTTTFSFGTRHVHPSIAAVVERASIVGGLDGISNVAAGDILERDPGGTMPHALVICFGRGEQAAAWAAFDEAAPDGTPRIALCDTYSDEVDESIRAATVVGEALDGVRLDTTGSRRGDYPAIVREVRWELDARGYDDVDIFCSGGLDPATMRTLRDHADGFGVGSHITDASPVNFALDIVAVEGEPAAKRGKLSGPKEAYRTERGRHVVRHADRSGPSNGEALLAPLLRDGEVVRSFDLDDAAHRARSDAKAVGFRVDDAA